MAEEQNKRNGSRLAVGTVVGLVMITAASVAAFATLRTQFRDHRAQAMRVEIRQDIGIEGCEDDVTEIGKSIVRIETTLRHIRETVDDIRVAAFCSDPCAPD